MCQTEQRHLRRCSWCWCYSSKRHNIPAGPPLIHYENSQELINIRGHISVCVCLTADTEKDALYRESSCIKILCMSTCSRLWSRCIGLESTQVTGQEIARKYIAAEWDVLHISTSPQIGTNCNANTSASRNIFTIFVYVLQDRFTGENVSHSEWV